MFIISVEKSFTASHQLVFPDGSKETPHDHNWVVIVKISGNKLDNIGLVMNFHDLKAILENILTPLSNVSLNSLKYFKENVPSAENVAKYIFNKLESRLQEKAKLEKVIVEEEPGCTVEYYNSQDDF